MGDLVWFIVTGVIFILLSAAFIVLGLKIWKKQRMDLIIRHHCDKVTEENKKAYCALSGIGLLLMGTGFGLTAIYFGSKKILKRGMSPIVLICISAVAGVLAYGI